VLIAPNPAWVATLPGGKLPDRHDFTSLSYSQRVAQWTQSVSAARQLADEWQAWLHSACPADALQDL
jgi:hypothetical protein